MQASLAQAPSTITEDASAAAPIPAARTAGGAPAGNAFVINLISSTTPVVLTRPDHAGLRRFTFFVSRRREEGRERFRLHMGYFDTQEEAEKLLDIVRTIYPGAWAGLAPGRRLAAGGAPGATSTAASTAASERTREPSASREPQAPPRTVETPPLALMPDEGRRQLSDVTLDLGEPLEVQRSVATTAAAAGAAAAAAADADDVPARDAIGRPPGAGPSGELERRAARQSFSNVRETIASLADSAIRAPALSQIPELKPAIIPTARPIARPLRSSANAAAPATVNAAAPATVARAANGANGAELTAELTDTATLRLLEKGNPAKTPAADGSGPPSQTPQTVRMRRASASAQAEHPLLASRSAQSPQAAKPPRDEKPWYAVQLVWSVQPIALTHIPQLAIFSAYTLYGAEGNRDGRRWYGLRLGFFTDAVSAKQVAHYVRADFATVSVVPVTARERDQALQAVSRATPAALTAAGAAGTTTSPGTPEAAAGSGTAGKQRRGGSAAVSSPQAKEPEFAFIEGTDSQINRLHPGTGRTAADRAATAPRPPGMRPTRGAPGKRAKQRPPGQVHARARAKPRTLEETLEILGAGELQVADNSTALINEASSSVGDAGVRHLKLEGSKAKSSKLARLFDRLAERIGN